MLSLEDFPQAFLESMTESLSKGGLVAEIIFMDLKEATSEWECVPYEITDPAYKKKLKLKIKLKITGLEKFVGKAHMPLSK